MSNDGSADSSLSIYLTVMNVISIVKCGHGRNGAFNYGMGNYLLAAYLCHHGRYHYITNIIMQRIKPQKILYCFHSRDFMGFEYSGQ